MCSRQICSNCVMLSCQYGPKSLRNVSNTLLNQCHKELKQLFCQVPLWSLIACFAICLHSKSVCVCVCPVPVRCWWDIVSTVPYCTHMLIVTLYTGSALNPLHLLISLSLFPWMLPNSSLHLKAKCKSFQWISKRPRTRGQGVVHISLSTLSVTPLCVTSYPAFYLSPLFSPTVRPHSSSHIFHRAWTEECQRWPFSISPTHPCPDRKQARNELMCRK